VPYGRRLAQANWRFVPEHELPAEQERDLECEGPDLVHHVRMVTSEAVIDMKHVLAREREVVDGLIAMHLERYKASGAELVMGIGRFIAPKTIEVSLNDGGTRVLVGNRVACNDWSIEAGERC
jgi:hypothetical protein